MAAMRLCSIEGCGKKHKGRGFCDTHAYHVRKYGDPFAGRTPPGTAIKWVEEVALKHTSDECLTWPFWRFPNGRGAITHNGRSQNAARYVLSRAKGQPDDSRLEAAHSCGMGHEACVSPRHLRWATSSENKADHIEHGTANRGERNGRTKLSDEDARAIRSLKGRLTKQQLAEKFGVSVGVIDRVQSRHSFKYLT